MEISHCMNERDIRELRSLIDSQITTIYPSGPKSLTQTIRYVLEAGGKRLRPILTLLSAQTFGTTITRALPAAIAVEILHNFTLVHDDIMDEDSTRHGQPTVHEKWDLGNAILTGDAMLSLALRILQNNGESHDLMTVFTTGLLRVCEGQALDKEFETDKNVSLEDYIQMIDLKTGHLIGLASEMGAIVANADAKTRIAVRDYGRLIGRAFQIQDDLLEIYSDSEIMGKSLKSDIILGKKTFLMIKAREVSSIEIDKAVKQTRENFAKGKQEIQNILNDMGVTRLTQDYIAEIICSANEKIADIPHDMTDILYFSDMITRRNN